MSYPSLWIGKFHFLQLIANLILSVGLLATATSYFMDTDFYWFHLTQWDWTLRAIHRSFYWITHISFLAWMFQVHTAIRRFAPRYPVSPGGFVLRMLPLVQLWGIASTFVEMKRYFNDHPAIGGRGARVVMYFPLIYIFSYTTFWFYDPVHSIERSSMGLTLAGITIFALASAFYLILTYRINQHLYLIAKESPVVLWQQYRETGYPVYQASPEFQVSPAYQAAHVQPAYPADRAQPGYQSITPAYGYPPVVIAANPLRGARFAAHVIDTLIMIVLLVVAFVIGMTSDESGDTAIGLVILALIGWVIYLAIHLSLRGQTIGKLLMGIRIVKKSTGENGGFVANFLLRSVVNYLIAMFVPLYSIIDACFIFTSDGRCLHDLIAGTIVVRVNDSNYASNRQSPFTASSAM